MILLYMLLVGAVIGCGLWFDVAFNASGNVLFSADGNVLFDCGCCCPEKEDCTEDYCVQLGASGEIDPPCWGGFFMLYFNDLLGAYGTNTGSFEVTFYPVGDFPGGTYTVSPYEAGTEGPDLRLWQVRCPIPYEATGTIDLDGPGAGAPNGPDGNGLTAGAGWMCPGLIEFSLVGKVTAV